MAHSPDRHAAESADKHRTDQVVETAKKAATEASRAIEAGAVPVVQTGSAIIRSTALDTQNTVTTGARLVAEAAHHAVDASVAEARHAAEASAKVAAAQRTAAQETAGNVQALSSTYTQLGQGVLKMQRAYFDLLQDAMEKARQRPQQIMGCRSIPELAQVQRELYADGVGFMLNASTRMLQVAGEVVGNASRPLEARAHQDAE